MCIFGGLGQLTLFLHCMVTFVLRGKSKIKIKKKVSPPKWMLVRGRLGSKWGRRREGSCALRASLFPGGRRPHRFRSPFSVLAERGGEKSGDRGVIITKVC